MVKDKSESNIDNPRFKLPNSLDIVHAEIERKTYRDIRRDL